MSHILSDPPVSYIASLGIGFLIGAGVLIVNSGLFIFSRRITKERRSPELVFLSIIALIIGILFTSGGIFLFLILIFDTFTAKNQNLSLYLNVFVVLIVSAFMMIFYFLMTRRIKI